MIGNHVAVMAGRVRRSIGMRVLPDFIIIGAQKAGTTSLYSYLSAHPNVLRASRKEIHFFDVNYDRGLRWYRSHFPTGVYRYLHRRVCKGVSLTGEASPYYLFHPLAAQRAKLVVPDAKFLVMLRNPIDRAFSHFQHQTRRGRETRSFEEALSAEAETVQSDLDRIRRNPSHQANALAHYSYLARGIYADQLETWLRYFLRSQILVINSERFFAAPQLQYGKVLDFLGLPDQRLIDETAHNPGSYDTAMGHGVRARLVEYFRPHNTRLFELIGEEYDWN